MARQRIVLICIFILLTACTNPVKKIYDEAKRRGLTSSVVRGQGFDHVVFYHNMEKLGRSDTVHIYIEGDGRPYQSPTRISRDPTTQNPIALNLLSKDSRPSIYLGRPCYYGFADSPRCHHRYWTSHRYSREVVDSMAAAVRGYMGVNLKQKRLVFIGYSGGGALAMLLAPRFKNTRAVVTIAANLDTDLWADTNKLTPLSHSLNPARQPVLNRKVFQLHLAGGRDTNVPPEIIQAEVRRQTTGDLTLYDDFNHICCWENVWPDILNRYGLSLQ